jgi:hypothetical protein
MKPLSAGLTLVNVATVTGLLLGILGGGLNKGVASLAMLAGLAAAVFAWVSTSKEEPATVAATLRRSYPVWLWAAAVVFAMFAFRSFCWLIYIDGPNLKIQSPYDLGDLALHITYIRNFAHGVPLWPENPISYIGGLRYPAGMDFFNALLLCLHLDLLRGLIWVALLASLATFYAFYRWGGAFAVAGFLFNGGLACYPFLKTWRFIDYQGEHVAWKSIPLTMFVTQRGLLYAIPAGLLLLLHWRRKFFPDSNETPNEQRRGFLPWWVEWSLYASMPLFHVHTFLALSIVLGCWLIIGNWQVRKQIAILLSAAFLPATWMVWSITDHFKSKSILAFAPGWVQSDPGFALPPTSFGALNIPSAVNFWVYNFGLTTLAVVALVAMIGWGIWRQKEAGKLSFSGSFAFVAPAVVVFLFALLVRTAPWGWDNIKLIIWAYFISLPFLWRDLIVKCPVPVRYGVCLLLFASGFVSLIGGLAIGRPGFDIANRIEVYGVATATRKLPIGERFASFPTYNHPLLLNGRKVVCGYTAHLWTQGLDNYFAIEQQVNRLMLGPPDWRERARALHARYLFWGEPEKRAYLSGSQPWRGKAAIVDSGPWGTIYDLETTAPSLQNPD